MKVDLLNTPIEYLKGIGPKRGKLLRDELGVETYFDLITYYPFRYVDKSNFLKINQINSDEVYILTAGKVVGSATVGVGAATRFEVTITDNSGLLGLVWFRGIKWVKDKFPIGSEWVVFGKPSKFRNSYNMVHPDVEPLSDYTSQPADPFHPVYNTSEKLKQNGLGTRQISKLMKTLVFEVNGVIVENLNKDIISRLKLMSRNDALISIHFPSNNDNLKAAKQRLVFEELFFLQLKLLHYKFVRSTTVPGYVFDKVGDFTNNFYKNNLTFDLTNAQKRVIREIRNDMGSGKQLNRLLQGDVGSGKTIVALMCMLIAIDNNFQACLMAPTEILANQHYNTIKNNTENLNIDVELLTGSTKKSDRERIHSKVSSGETNILIGTHALIEDNVIFNNLGFVVIDEQHRFGVEQRAKLWKKSTLHPHVLVMTATPIPRTLAMTVYGDLDISVIDELPLGRKPIKTVLLSEKKRQSMFEFIHSQIKEGRQIYVVYPLIEESETLDLKNAIEGFEQLKSIFPTKNITIDILHGKMKPAEKDETMNKFKNGETKILVSTTVIEVGVDVPNASVMVIENSERFGLSQLHQLRGRVGRGGYQSFCVLMYGNKLTNDAKTRLKTMEGTNDGFEIANVDLKLRGPGDLEGTKQSGILEMKIADFIKDERIMKIAKDEAQKVLLSQNGLNNPENELISEYFKFLNKRQKNWSKIS